MDKIDRKIKEIKAEQAEKEALELIGQCRFEEAKKLLDAFEDPWSKERKEKDDHKRD